MTPTETDGDLRARVVTLEHQGSSREQRILSLEVWRQQSDVADARKDEQFKNMNDKIDGVGKKVDKISGDLSKIMWIFISAVVLAFATFVVKGGLNIPPT